MRISSYLCVVVGVALKVYTDSCLSQHRLLKDCAFSTEFLFLVIKHKWITQRLLLSFNSSTTVLSSYLQHAVLINKTEA